MVVILAKQVVAVMCLRVGTPQPVHGRWSLSVAFLQLQQIDWLAIFWAGRPFSKPELKPDSLIACLVRGPYSHKFLRSSQSTEYCGEQ